MKSFIIKHSEKLKVVIYCFLLSLIVISITSKCSFLYPFNDWVDANAFFTVGKCLAHNIIPYKDIFEQKGILLYVIYEIGYLMSHTTFHGVFILEVTSWTIALYYAYKTITLFISKKSAYLILPIFLALSTTSKAFVHGGSAEEFCIPLMLITLYYFMSHFKCCEINYKRLFIAGFLAGLVALIKYTLLGFWFGFMACIFFSLVFNKKVKKAFLSCIWFLLGMFSPILIAIIYFIFNHALKEFINVYILTNINMYASNETNIFARMFSLVLNYMRTTWYNGIIIFSLIIGSILAILKLNLKLSGKIYFIIIYIFSVLGLYYGLRFYPYYLFPMFIFIVISLIGIFSFFDKKLDKNKTITNNILICLVCVASILYSYFFANSKEMMKLKKEDLFQYKFAEIINQEENPTLVNISSLDCGVYTASDITPSTYFFEQQNISYDRFPDNLDAFKEYIENKETMFIVYYTSESLDVIKKTQKELFKNYKLIASEQQKNEQTIYNAFLFKVKED